MNKRILSIFLVLVLSMTSVPLSNATSLPTIEEGEVNADYDLFISEERLIAIQDSFDLPPELPNYRTRYANVEPFGDVFFSGNQIYDLDGQRITVNDTQRVDRDTQMNSDYISWGSTIYSTNNDTLYSLLKNGDDWVDENGYYVWCSYNWTIIDICADNSDTILTGKFLVVKSNHWYEKLSFIYNLDNNSIIYEGDISSVYVRDKDSIILAIYEENSSDLVVINPDGTFQYIFQANQYYAQSGLTFYVQCITNDNIVFMVNNDYYFSSISRGLITPIQTTVPYCDTSSVRSTITNNYIIYEGVPYDSNYLMDSDLLNNYSSEHESISSNITCDYDSAQLDSRINTRYEFSYPEFHRFLLCESKTSRIIFDTESGLYYGLPGPLSVVSYGEDYALLHGNYKNYIWIIEENKLIPIIDLDGQQSYTNAMVYNGSFYLSLASTASTIKLVPLSSDGTIDLDDDFTIGKTDVVEDLSEFVETNLETWYVPLAILLVILFFTTRGSRKRIKGLEEQLEMLNELRTVSDREQEIDEVFTSNNDSSPKRDFVAMMKDDEGYEWWIADDGVEWYRFADSGDEWVKLIK